MNEEDQCVSTNDRTVGEIVVDLKTNLAIADDRGISISISTQRNGCVVVFVPEECVESSLSCIHCVIKHAVHVARMGSTLPGTTK